MAIDERTMQEPTPAALAMDTRSVADDIEHDLAQVLTPTLASRLAGRLAQLETELTRRYESETCSALYQDVPNRKPRYERRLAELRREHRELIGRVRGLTAKTGNAADAASLSGARAQVLELMTDLRQHEEVEQRLLSEALVIDLGVGD